MRNEEDLALTDEEAAAGFTVQTLLYPEEYELPFPKTPTGFRRERGVALVMDDRNRIKRHPSGAGYVHERWDDDGWTVGGEFATLDEATASTVFRQYRTGVLNQSTLRDDGADRPLPGED